MGYRVEVDGETCISAGNCVRAAPRAFDFNDAEVAEPQPGVVDLPNEKLVLIARGCPVAAIHLYTDDGEEVDPWL